MKNNCHTLGDRERIQLLHGRRPQTNAIVAFCVWLIFSFSCQTTVTTKYAATAATPSSFVVFAMAMKVTPASTTRSSPRIMNNGSNNGNNKSSSEKTYMYFGYGSNVLPSTMKSLRQIEVREVTAAILPEYELLFFGMGGGPQIAESTAAVVRPVFPANDDANDNINDDNNGRRERRRSVVHGILYTLTAEEFAKIGRTEGVPFAYQWQSCFVYPYRGDGKQAGNDSLNDEDAIPIKAYTLVEPTSLSSLLPNANNQQRQREIRPSASYLGLIREGAKLWKFDQNYQDELASITVASNLLIPNGISELALQIAEKVSGTRRTYMIDGYRNE